MNKKAGWNVIGIIVARGGSKRLPRKNVLPINGKPLIAWTIEAGLAAKCIDRLVLSTDDQEISKVASEYGCEVPFVRPPELSTDEASSVDVVHHTLLQCPGFTHFILLQPTSPLRRAEHIDEAFQLMCVSGANACVSMRESVETPYWMFTVGVDGFVVPVAKEMTGIRSQSLPCTYIPNGAIYISTVNNFLDKKSFFSKDTVPYIMTLHDSVDIDTLQDLNMACSLQG